MEGSMRRYESARQLWEIAVLWAVFLMPAGAQQPNTKGAILQQLEAQYVPTQTTADKSDIVTAGSILTLKKDNLMTVAISSGSVCPNTYKDGRITQSAVAKITCGRAIGLALKRKIFLAGQKLWLTNIEVNDGSVIFELYTDAYAGERYRATLTFGFNKGPVPPVDAVEKSVAEVFSAEPPPAPASQPAPAVQPPAAPQAAPANQEAPLPPIDVPAAPPTEIRVGQTSEQVVAILGKPEKVVKLPTKEIYYYKNLTVTFVNGKMTDAQ
jgi:hypothetical protein